jgi:hypothetical protein
MDNGALRDAYCQKRLTKAQLLELVDFRRELTQDFH